ncbi:triacylglycerol lipase [Teladorsagia circumcincta]|uniref:Triacylglycerol lipase n=1 Tax=Teladorsagia circumcincta TaxID=45464 RepID=A0A2G9UWX0_TELCI|nr:triacylglycerol lipase [Teladorsagia circumcincta]
MRQLVLLVVVLAQLLRAEFTPHFRKFIHDSFGISIASTLERTDLGLDASFGGQLNDNDKPKKQAVIIVHGITNKITRFLPMVQFLRSQGYTNSEVYGTTYGDAGATPIGLVDMKCSYVKQIRSFIIAVRQYTGTQVDIVAYSMGAPIARKAILGGNCMDTREILEANAGRLCNNEPRIRFLFKIAGPPLTELIDTFVSVAGANHGSVLCVVPIPVGTCNRRTGLHCDSTFLQDINNQAGYEGTYVFSIFSTADEKVFIIFSSLQVH